MTKLYSWYVAFLGFFNLHPEDIVSVFKGAVIAALGAALTYAIKYFSGHDFGIGGAVVLAILVNIGRKSVDTPVEKITGVSI